MCVNHFVVWLSVWKVGWCTPEPAFPARCYDPYCLVVCRPALVFLVVGSPGSSRDWIVGPCTSVPPVACIRWLSAPIIVSLEEGAVAAGVDLIL